MVRAPSEAALEALRHPLSIEEQIASLKVLKNDIVGHDQRKELVVKYGAIDALVEVLSSASRTNGKRRLSDVNGSSEEHRAWPWTQEDEARLQATLILGSLATGGPAFVAPLLASNVVWQLLSGMSVYQWAPKQDVASLQALKAVAVAWSALQDGPSSEQDLVAQLYRGDTASYFKEILSGRSSSLASRHMVELTCELISLSSASEPVKNALEKAGVLDSLASLLASHAVVNGYYEGSNYALPSAPTIASLPYILDAVSAIISGSNYRAHRFFLSPPLRKLFEWAAKYSATTYVDRMGPLQQRLLPDLHVPVHKSVSFHGGSSAFPALGSLQHSQQHRFIVDYGSSSITGDVAHASYVCSWLIHLARSLQGTGRLAALRLLALVNTALDVDVAGASYRSESMIRARERERQIALLAVPLAVKITQDSSTALQTDLSVAASQDQRRVKEEACSVLAMLIAGSKELQAAAVDAGAIKHVCPLLKKSFDTVTLAKPMWSSRSQAPGPTETSPTRTMGSRGLPPEIVHAMKCRQGALEAIAAITKKEDTHRKAIVESGVVVCIIEALTPFSPSILESLSSSSRSSSTITPKDGNTTGVLLAACYASTSMSRSVSLLRTSLIDAGIAKPISALLEHADSEIQVAATDVCCNLVLEFSPMREDLIQAGVVKTLTNHARRSSPPLRLSSLWALKHLVLNAPRDVRIACLEELGSGWLVQAITGDSHAASTTAPVGMSTPNAAGEQVDLLNPSDMDVDPQSDDDLDSDDASDGEVLYDDSSGTRYQASQLRSTLKPPQSDKARLSAVRELEQNPALQAKRDDVQIQEQALDFVRNFINGEESATLIDHLMATIGTTKIFDLLTAKLAPMRTSPSSKPLYQPPELILAAVHVLTHIAGASPRHRQLIIAQKPLLLAWLAHFRHEDRRIRVMSVWAVNSLTWIEDESDRVNARGRAVELRAMGIEEAVRGLSGDGDLDVRERVKTAVRQMDSL